MTTTLSSIIMLSLLVPYPNRLLAGTPTLGQRFADQQHSSERMGLRRIGRKKHPATQLLAIGHQPSRMRRLRLGTQWDWTGAGQRQVEIFDEQRAAPSIRGVFDL